MKKKMVKSVLYVVLSALALHANAQWVAYHDLGAITGQESTGNITTHQSGPSGKSDNPLDTGVKRLIKYSDGADTGVDLTIAGANGMDSRTGVTAPPAAGTPAAALFNVAGLNLTNGFINKQNGAMTITLSGLNPAKVYDIAIYGDRTLSADGAERFTLDGAESAVNSSSTGIQSTFVTDMQTRPNAAAGNVVRWTRVTPGSDGTLAVVIDPTITSSQNIAYLSAVRLEEREPLAGEWTAFHDLGAATGFESAGHITTHQSGASTEATNTVDVGMKNLIAYADGSDTGVNFTIAGATGMDSRTNGVTRPPVVSTPLTPAALLFNTAGLDLSNGVVFCTGGSMTLTFSALHPDKVYDLALYGDFNLAADGAERFTLGGAVSAVNMSVTGIRSTFVTDQESCSNATAGRVVRWTGIKPGITGTMTVTVNPTVNGSQNLAALSALRLREITPVEEWVSYHDLGATTGYESTGYITTHQSGTGAPVTLDTGTKGLIAYQDGSDIGVAFRIESGPLVDARNGGECAPPDGGTPAAELFNIAGLNLSNGLIYRQQHPITFVFANLNPSSRYDLALYGNRVTSADAVERFTLNGAAGAVNTSSTGIVSDFISDMRTRPNKSDYVRWTELDPGSDGRITVTVDPAVAGNIAYLSAVRLEKLPGSYPVPVTALGIVNPGFEFGTAPYAGADGWTIATGVGSNEFYTTDGTGLSPVDPASAQEGAQFLTANRQALDPEDPSNPATSLAVQRIDVSGYHRDIDGAAGVMIDLTFFFSNRESVSGNRVEVAFFGAGGGSLGSLTSGNLPISLAWQAGGVYGAIPPGTRSLEIQVRAARPDGTGTNVSYDNFTAVLFGANPLPPKGTVILVY